MSSQIKDISQLPEVLNIIHQALNEDVGTGDHSSLSCISEDKISTARLIFKDEGIAAGISIAFTILKLNDPDIEITQWISDGERVSTGSIGFEAKGKALGLLKSERLLLNIMQRLSGIATVTAKAVEKIGDRATKVLDTRKTTPNLRLLEKWAVTAGGGYNHRFGLYDMVMLKDNHVDVAGGISNAIRKAKAYLEANQLNLGIEIETRNLEEVRQVLEELPVQRIMLDNYTPEQVAEAVKLIAGRAETEASGGITLDNISDYAEAGVDFISLGMLTHSVKSLDISFKIKL
ncbi:MAG: carboxylating nicotinate-nucleotide diphosphorylase [Bacteroidetes bacterium]|nr:carboxylating nicotinate-nucleotide diphosphorylase [Bacteroidota bacterium]